jgi:hypothetical protein
MFWRLPATLALWLGLSAGCAQIVTFDEYTYDIDPCGSQPPECETGNDLAYITTVLDLAREGTGNTRDGFDLDATSEAICGQRDLISPSGVSGVDNQLAPIVELYESLEGVNVGSQLREAFLRGEGLTLIRLRGVDSLENDACVDVSSRTARLPASEPLSSLDSNGDGLIDPSVAFEVEAPTMRDATGCIINGVLHARFPPVPTVIPGIAGEVIAERQRMRASISTSSIQGALGGALSVDGLIGGVPPEIVEFLRGRADISPSSPTARDCESISFGVVFDGVPASVITR